MKGHFVYGLFECIEWEIIGVLGSVVRSESYSSKLLHRVTIYLRTKGYVNLDFDTDIEAHKAHNAVSEAIKRNVKREQIVHYDTESTQFPMNPMPTTDLSVNNNFYGSKQ